MFKCSNTFPFCCNKDVQSEEQASELFVNKNLMLTPDRRATDTNYFLFQNKRLSASPSIYKSEVDVTKDYNSVNRLSIQTAIPTPALPLTLTVLDSDFLERDKVINLPYNRSSDSLRGSEDRPFFFGAKSSESNENKANFLALGEEKSGEKSQFAEIVYNKETCNYELSDLGGGGGIYIFVDKEMKVKNNMIFYIGDSHLFIKTKDDGDYYNITLKTIDGQHSGKIFSYDYTKKITIGRDMQSKLYFDDFGISRLQCTLLRREKTWYLQDCDGVKKSTNGTWILVEKKTNIFDGMKFKVGSTLFQAHNK